MFQEGQQIGLYILIRKLGRGGFGEVWLAERKSKFVTTKVAVKLPLDEQVDHEAIRQEATLWEQASGHPNVLPIIDADEYNGQIVIVSEYAPDGSLADMLKQFGKLPAEKAVELTLGILAGLEYLHSRQIVHRDLKPANILLQGETPRLADFGISRALKTTQTSQSVNITGTPPYMSPEAFDGKRNVQTDVWSVGVILYYLLAGHLPFPQQDLTSLIGAIINRNPEQLPDSVPQSIKNVVLRALAKNLEQRFISAAEMQTALRKAVNGWEQYPVLILPQDDYESETIVSKPKQQPKTRSNVFPIIGAIGIFLMILIILGSVITMIYPELQHGNSDSKIVVEQTNKTNPTPTTTMPLVTPSLVQENIQATPTTIPKSITPLPTQETVQTPSDNEYASNTLPDSNETQEIPNEQYQQAFNTGRQLLKNDMLKTAQQKARNQHSFSKLQGCSQNVSRTLQSAQSETYVGVYQCLLRGAIVGKDMFEVEIIVSGGIELQGRNLVRNVFNVVVRSDRKINVNSGNTNMNP